MNAVEVKLLILVLKHKRTFLGELSSLAGVPGNVVTEILRKHGDAIKIHGEEVVVNDPVLLALKLANMNVELSKISELLSWRDFEVFSSRLLEESGYSVVRGLKMTYPVRFEIDVFAVEPSTGFSVAVDCKHWSISSTSRLIDAAERHSNRVKKLIEYYLLVKSKYKAVERAKAIVPLIVTLLTPSLRAHSGVLILSIKEFPHFIVEKYSVMDYFEVKPFKVGHK